MRSYRTITNSRERDETYTDSDLHIYKKVDEFKLTEVHSRPKGPFFCLHENH